MRKALLVVALVAASFAGAAVNGPGLKWAKSALGSRLHDSESIPTLDVSDGPPKPRPDEEPDPPSGRDAIPSTPAPPLGSDFKPRDRPAASAPPRPRPEPEAPPRLQEEPPAADHPAPEPVRARPDPAPEPPPVANTPNLADPPRDDPAVSATSGPNPASSPELPVSPPSASWALLRKKMEGLGVTRYWLEGAPGGPSVFRCFVPLAGSDSVGQQFQAEGDDDLQAAEAALRRIALWRASERP